AFRASPNGTARSACRRSIPPRPRSTSRPSTPGGATEGRVEEGRDPLFEIPSAAAGADDAHGARFSIGRRLIPARRTQRSHYANAAGLRDFARRSYHAALPRGSPSKPPASITALQRRHSNGTDTIRFSRELREGPPDRHQRQSQALLLFERVRGRVER